MLATQQLGQFCQRDVLLCRDRGQEHGAERLDPVGARVAPLRLWLDGARHANGLDPPDGAGSRDAKLCGCLTPGQAARDGTDDPRPKIIRERLAHACWPPAQQAGSITLGPRRATHLIQVGRLTL